MVAVGAVGLGLTLAFMALAAWLRPLPELAGQK
jgi:hypothetical protein